jgi:hypothetical protein
MTPLSQTTTSTPIGQTVLHRVTCSANQDKPAVRDARDLSKEVLFLQATSPSTFAVTALGGHRFAWIKPAGPAGPDQLIVADPLTLQEWMKDEWKNGTITGWPETISECTSSSLHNKLLASSCPLCTPAVL